MTRQESITREEFLRHLRRSKLLSPDEFKAAVRGLPATSRGRSVARILVKTGVLTRFQARLLLAGRTEGFVLGQYRVLEQVGKGGMGRVFKAVHETMKRTVAVKVLAPKLVETPKARMLFEREVLAAGRLAHPNIVAAYDANQSGDRHYLVMEFVDGPNLDQLVRQHGPLPVPLACEIIRQVALGLQHAHEMETVHCDIKPTNIVVQRSPGRSATINVKILDFGLSRFQQASQYDDVLYRDKNKVMGTPDFLSPEQSRSLQELDIRSDLYSLGCTLYFLLSGQPPFPGGTAQEKVARHNTEEPKPIRELRAEISEAVAGIIRKLMAKQPGDRFQTPAELALALSPFAVVESAAALDAVRSRCQTPTDPAPEDGSEELASPQQDSELAIGSTFPSEFGPTPMSAVDLPPSVEPAAHGMNKPLVISLAIGAAAMAAVAIWFVLR